MKPYVKREKNDAADAEAILEAVIRPTMRFVSVKTLAQQSVMVLHRPRELLMHKRVGLASRDGDREAPLNSGRIKVTSLQNSVFVCDSVTWGFKKSKSG